MILRGVKHISVLTILIVFLSGCGGSRMPALDVKHYEEKGIRLIALMPVDNKTKDEEAAAVLRHEVLEGLYFKGYPKIPLDVVDEKITSLYAAPSAEPEKGDIPPVVLGELLGVDAVMYCTLEEWKTSSFLVYARTAVSATFTLRSAKTGETLWSARDGSSKQHYDFTQKRLEIKSHQVYEAIIQEIVTKVLSTLPDGPDAIGKAPPREPWWKLW
jgi:hypothetical protein